MGTYLTFETESELEQEEHSVQDEDEEARLRELARLALEDEQKNKVVTEVYICSCGFHTCPVIVRFGLPFSIFKGDIEPLFPQMSRDKRALDIREGK
jgi:hypothetical protein